ncbi:hypothetical protein [Rothia nasimurium]|uniref:hypothetical protein n=1 Tax=Rothia nasimurium TaxID=85336 RepID=UPI001F487B05|nr:hypothetical protein [Rothia nasimurium]
MTPDELTRLRQLHEQASPAPWVIADYPDPQPYGVAITAICAHRETVVSQLSSEGCVDGLLSPSLANFELITEARNALPALLEHIDKLTQRAERAEGRLARINRANPGVYEEVLAGDAA